MKTRFAPLAVTLMLLALAALQMAPAGLATSPQACFTSPSNVAVGQTFSVDASCSTNTQHTFGGISFRWNFDAPAGPWVQASPPTNPFHSHAYATAGTYTIRLEVTDMVTGDIVTSSRTIVVGPAGYAPAWGYIWIYHDGLTFTTDNSYQYSGWVCTPFLIPHPHVQCIAPAPPSGFVGWQCPGLALSAGAFTHGSSVNGEFECLDSNTVPSSVSTGDLYGPNAWAWTSTPVVTDIVSITCHARPTTGALSPQPAYYVLCGDP